MIVALIGKPNVGKSTIFNRLINKKKSIVGNAPGITRDRIYGECDWLNKRFNIIDTGGLTNQKLSLQKNIEEQTMMAINEADLILFVVSLKDGINNDDFFINKLLKKKTNKKVILVINKYDNINNEKLNFNLGFSKQIYISSEHGIGFGDLLDLIVSYIDDKHEFIKKEKIENSFCIIGKTNVGKSTLMNSILKKQRVLVSNQPHTTRDSVDSILEYGNKKYVIIDTAGIRRKGKITDEIEKYAILRTIKSIEQSKIVVLMIDGSLPISEQDEVIGGIAYKHNIPTIICINKWDLVKKDNFTMQNMISDIRIRFKYLSWAPIIFISAKNSSRIDTLFKTIDKINEQLKVKISSSTLNDVLSKSQIINPPPLYKGGRLNIINSMQINASIPTFILFVNKPEYLSLSYSRFLENQIRESFGFDCVPITLYFKDKNARNRGKRV